MGTLRTVSSTCGLIAIAVSMSSCQGLQSALDQTVAQANQEIIAALDTQSALQNTESGAASTISSGILSATAAKGGGHDIPGTLIAFTEKNFSVNVTIDDGHPGIVLGNTSGQQTVSKIPQVTVGPISYLNAPAGFQLQAQVPWSVSWNSSDLQIKVNFPICSGIFGCAVTIPTGVDVNLTNASVNGGTITYLLDNNNHSSVKVSGSVSTSMEVTLDGINITGYVQPSVNKALDQLITDQLTTAVNDAVNQANQQH